MPAVREFVDVLVKADIPGIRLSVGRVYTVTESFIRDISRLQTERVDTILCKKQNKTKQSNSYGQFSEQTRKTCSTKPPFREFRNHYSLSAQD